MKKQIQHERLRSWGRRARIVLALGLSLGVLSACDTLLEVELPAQLTDAALTDPKGANVQVLTIIAHFEDAWDIHNYRTLGREEGGEVYLCGPMCNVSQYITDYEHFVPFSRSLKFNRELRAKLLKEWTVQDVPLRDQYLAITSIYEGATLGVFGTNLCEVSLNGGPKQTPADILNQADAALTRALGEIAATGDFALPNGISSSARTMTYGLRAQIRWFKGDNAGALADAAQVPKGFVAFVTREQGVTSTGHATPTRQNMGWTSGTGGGFFELYDPIDWWRGRAVPNPVTGQLWPAVLPFTGWTYLGILPDGRAISEDGMPVRTRAGWHNAHGVTPGAVLDTRVRHITAQVAGKQALGEVPGKFTGEGSDEPIVNWKDMVLIRAEIEGGQRAIDLVNELRTTDNLPRVTYADPANARQIRYLIFEERRRALFNEARFFYTKLKNLDTFWFPRNVGGTRVQNRLLQGGIRYTMPGAEYVANTNLTTADRATGCGPNERPVIN